MALVINGSIVSHDGTFEFTTNVTEGVNTFLVTATDAAGNMVNWTKTRLVDIDNLPDYYEVNVTGTDSLDGDSDFDRAIDGGESNIYQAHLWIFMVITQLLLGRLVNFTN